MERLKNFFSNLFLYHEPSSTHSFSLPEMDKKETNDNIENISTPDEKLNSSIYSSLDVNIDFIKIKYNTLINSDIILRNFTLYAKGKEYKALLIFIDGMVETNLINNFILRPLMSKDNSNAKPVSSVVTNNITVKRIKKFNIEEYIYSSILPQNSIKKTDNFKEFICAINTGQCGLLVDSLPCRIYFRC